MLALALVLIACDGGAPAPAVSEPAADVALPPAPAGEGVLAGVVAEVVPGGGYTYVRLTPDAGEPAWFAAPGEAPSVGARLSLPTSMPMRDFHSKALERDFPLVYFVEGFGPRASAAPAAPMSPHGAGNPHGSASPHGASPAPAAVPELPKAEGDTHNFAGLMADRAALAGQRVTISGAVVKVSPEIMGRNWVHVQDAAGTDLTITTAELPQVGAGVQVSAKVEVDQDFGAGYSYALILTEATFQTK